MDSTQTGTSAALVTSAQAAGAMGAVDYEEQLRAVKENEDSKLAEIERRKTAAAGKRFLMRDYNKAVAQAALPADMRADAFGYMLFVVTGPGFERPASPHTGVLLLSYFGNADAAEAMAEATSFAAGVVAPKIPNFDIRLMAVDDWVVVASTPERMLDAEYCRTRVQENLDAYFAYLRGKQRAFVNKVERTTGKDIQTGAKKEDNERAALKQKMDAKLVELGHHRLGKAVKEKVTGEQQMKLLGLAADKEKDVSARKEMVRKQVRDKAKGMPRAWPVPSDVVRRSQVCAAVCFLEDMRKAARKGRITPEPMIRVLRVYPSVEAARKDVDENLSDAIVDFDIDIVDLGEWLFPWDVDYDKIESFRYRDDEQDKIMQRRLISKQEVKRHERQCAEMGESAQELFLKSAEDAAVTLPPEEYLNAHKIPGTVTVAATQEEAIKFDQRDVDILPG